MNAAPVLPVVDGRVRQETLRECAVAVLEAAGNKRRNFLETVELQLALKQYDRRKNAKLAGTVKLQHVPKPFLRVCFLGHKARLDEAKECGMDYINWEKIKELKGRPNKIRQLARKYHAFVASDFAMTLVNKVVGQIFRSVNRPIEPVSRTENLADKMQELKCTTRFRMRKILTFGMCIGHVKMKPDELVDNANTAITHLMGCLKNNWDNVQFFILKSSMGPPMKIYQPPPPPEPAPVQVPRVEVAD